ncbi:olfactomedin-like protein 3 [Chanos chanos]|uniref:Olfactomedin-like protein 3 n=1 Tax=Chanos chanos TaxID=29144 RepID=A0A6J2WGA5_CHACN|nr:olfactomedin-like protein 1 [Chanos chanos]
MRALVLKLFALLIFPTGIVQSQVTTQERVMMQYFQRSLQELEARLIKCDQDILQFNQKMYDLLNEMHGQLRKVNVLKSEVKSHVDGLAMRVERVERDVEYLHSKIPNEPSVEVEESLLEQELKEAQLKKQAAFNKSQECSAALSGIRSLKIVKKTDNVDGSWMKDTIKDSAKIYFFSGTRNSTLLEFVSLKSFTAADASKKLKVIALPHPWRGTGHAVYKGFVYYHLADTPNEILKVHLLNRTVTDRMLLPGAGRIPVYALSPHTFIDLAVDELGLWAIHADPDFGGNLVITKLDANSLAIEHTWDTLCKSRDAEAAVMICGTLYVVYNSRYGGRSSVQCLFDINDTLFTEDSNVIFFPKRYASHSSLKYYPKDKQLYAWDDGYQTIYKLETRRKG